MRDNDGSRDIPQLHLKLLISFLWKINAIPIEMVAPISGGIDPKKKKLRGEILNSSVILIPLRSYGREGVPQLIYKDSLAVVSYR